jgi:hypothetical protein
MYRELLIRVARLHVMLRCLAQIVSCETPSLGNERLMAPHEALERTRMTPRRSATRVKRS